MTEKQTLNNKITLTYQGKTIEYHIESMYWEYVGWVHDPVITLRGHGLGHLRIEVQIPGVLKTLPEWLLQGMNNV